MKKVLFVCTGNTCRSPMAMAIYNKLTGSNSAHSAGVQVFEPMPAAENAKKVLKKFGISLDDHFSRQISKDLFDESDIIITMTNGQKNILSQFFTSEKIITLGEFAGGAEDVPDPYGGDEAIYETTARTIYYLIKKGLFKNISYADESDVSSIVMLENKTFKDAWSEKNVSEFVRSKRIIVYKQNDEIVGYCIFMLAADEGEILRIAVDNDQRKRGIGRKLLSCAIAFLKECGASFVYLEVRESNIPAISLYEQAGFKRIGVRHGYYHDNKEDAVLFNLNIKDRL